MTTTTFVTGTVIPVTWLNEVNNTIYTLMSDGTNPPSTTASIITRLLLQSQIAQEKGDLLAADAGGLYGNLSPGANGAVLTLDSTQTRGMAWQTLTFADYTPSVSVDSGSLSNVTLVRTRYASFGKMLIVHLDITFTVAGGAPDYIYVIPPGSVSLASTFPALPSGIIVNGALEIGTAGVSIGGNIAFQRVPLAAWSGSCEINGSFTLEIA